MKKNKFDDIKNSNVCMVDGEIVNEGYKIDESDVIIKLIKSIKKRFGVVRNNKLYICKEHYDTYLKKRKSYERMLILVAGLIAFLFVFGVLIPLFSGTFSFVVLISFLLISFMMLFLISLLHVPKVEDKLTVIHKKTPKKEVVKKKDEKGLIKKTKKRNINIKNKSNKSKKRRV